MKRTPLRLKTPLRTKSPKSPSKRTKQTRLTKTRKRTKKGYKAPKWFNQIPYGSHGNTPHTKRLWKVISDTYRQEDWELSPTCGACGKHLEHWSHGDLGHWLRYSVCRGWMKYERINLCLICKGCNISDDAITLLKMGDTLKYRYGENVLDEIERRHRDSKPTRIEVWQAVDYVATIRPDLVDTTQ